MEVEMIRALSTMGFNGLLPAVLCVYLIASGSKREQKNAEAINELRKTVENNTRAITRLMYRMDIKERRDNDDTR